MIRSYLYHPDGQLECDVPIERFREALHTPDALLWVDIEDAEDADIECLLEVFELHPLTVEDCIMPNLRPKLEEFERYLFVVLQGLKRNDKGRLVPLELDLCAGDNFLLTVRSEPIKSLDDDRVRVEKKSPIIKRGSDFLFYALVDSFIDSCFPILDEVEERVDKIQTRLLADPTRAVLTELIGISNELVALHRILGPQREILMRLNRGDIRFIKSSNAIYFRDTYDHLLRMIDLVDSCRAVTTQAMEVHATMVQNRLNEIMKTMTALGTLTIPLILITGIYGMNFHEHPGLVRFSAFFSALSTLLWLSIPFALYYFRKYRWL